MPERGGAERLRFEGFADTQARFFHALARNQNREWFQAHKHEYEEGWVMPMKALLAEVRDKIDRFFPHYDLGEPKVFRIFRDVRFSRDKSPYKTHIGGYIPLERAGTRAELPAPLYVQFGTRSMVGAGHYMMDPGQIDRYRKAVLDERRGRDLVAILARLTRAGFVIGSHEMLKKVPRGFDPAHPRADLLKRKSLTVAFPTLPTDQIVSRALIGWLVKETRRVAPLIEWLAAATE
jgi:uncharacterized protein (TIGR02453 family)